MTDSYTDELFPVSSVEAGRVVFPVSRLVCDVERFSSDDDEPMAGRGMGVIYTRTSLGEVLRLEPTPLERQQILDLGLLFAFGVSLFFLAAMAGIISH